VLWRTASPSAPPVAVEIELTIKGSARLLAICRAWARARCVAGVIYVVSPQAARPVATAIEQAGAAGRVVLLALESLDGLPPRESTVAVRA
jgi:hypothetical protein